MQTISQMAFDAVDTNGDSSLDFTELSTILNDIAKKMNIPPPTDIDIKAVL